MDRILPLAQLTKGVTGEDTVESVVEFILD